MEIAAQVVRRVHGPQRWLQSNPRKTAQRLQIQVDGLSFPINVIRFAQRIVFKAYPPALVQPRYLLLSETISSPSIRVR